MTFVLVSPDGGFLGLIMGVTGLTCLTGSVATSGCTFRGRGGVVGVDLFRVNFGVFLGEFLIMSS